MTNKINIYLTKNRDKNFKQISKVFVQRFLEFYWTDSSGITSIILYKIFFIEKNRKKYLTQTEIQKKIRSKDRY